VRFLREQEWPDDAVSRAVLDLFYAHRWSVTPRSTRGRFVAERVRATTRSTLSGGRWSRSWPSQPRLRPGVGRARPVGRVVDRRARPLHRPERLPGADPRHAARCRLLLWVELLADSSLWRPGQANQLYQLDVAALVAGDPARSGALDWPTRGSTARQDRRRARRLEAWHGSAGGPRRRWRRGSSGCAGCTRRLRAPTTSAPCASTCRGCSRASTAATSGGRWARPSSPGCCRERTRPIRWYAPARRLWPARAPPGQHRRAALPPPGGRDRGASFSLEAMALDGATAIRSASPTATWTRSTSGLRLRPRRHGHRRQGLHLLPGYREVPQWIADRQPVAGGPRSCRRPPTTATTRPS